MSLDTRGPATNTETMGKRRTRREGFTLLEAMTTLTILAVLSGIAVQNFSRFKARARRPEATIFFRSLADVQDSHLQQFGRYSDNFDDLGMVLDSGRRLSSNEIAGDQYNYKLLQLQGPKTWYCVATGNIDSDPFPDVLAAQNP